MCKPHKDQRRKDSENSQTMQERRAMIDEAQQMADLNSEPTTSPDSATSTPSTPET